MPRLTVSSGVPDGPEAGPPPWLADLAAPESLARWASSFADLRSCWDACRDPEWLLWLTARTSAPGEQRKPVALCAGELASMALRGGQDADPRVGLALSMMQMWAGFEADAGDLLVAEYGALEAARRSAEAADRQAWRALMLYRSVARRRLSSFGMSRAHQAWQRWRELERGQWLALSVAAAARAAALADDASLSPGEWAEHVSESAELALRALSGRRTQGSRPGWLVMRRCMRLARRRLAPPLAAVPEWELPD